MYCDPIQTTQVPSPDWLHESTEIKVEGVVSMGGRIAELCREVHRKISRRRRAETLLELLPAFEVVRCGGV